MTTQCICDIGFFGSDCSLRMCPKGDDPLTTLQNTRCVLDFSLEHIYDVQSSSTSGVLLPTTSGLSVLSLSLLVESMM